MFQSITVIKNFLTAFLVFILYVSNGQDCLDLWKNIQKYEIEKPPAAKESAFRLLQNLDSGICITEIGYAETYNNLGLTFWRLNEQEEALKSINKGIDLMLKTHDSSALAMVPYYENISAIYKEMASFSQAYQYVNYAWECIKSNSNERDPIYIESLIKRAGFFREIGDLEQSKKELNHATEIVKSIAPIDDSLQAILLIELGTIRSVTGEYLKAEEDFNSALAIIRGKYPLLHSQAIDRLARLKLNEGDFAESESQLLSNLHFKSTNFPKDSLILAESMNNLGLLYYQLNDLENARKYFLQLEKISENHPTIRPYVKNNLAVIDSKTNDLIKAKAEFEESLEMFRRSFGPLHPDYVNCLNNIAGIYQKLGETEMALSTYMKVIDLDKAIYGENHEKYASSLTNLAAVYKSLGHIDIALKYLKKSAEVRLNTLGKDHHLYAKNLNEIGSIHLARGESEDALKVFDQALRIEIDHLHDVFPVLTERQRNLFYERIQLNLRRFLGLAFSDEYFNTEWSEKALDYYINSKSIIYYAADKLRRIIQSSNDPSLKNMYQEWGEVKFELARTYLLSEHERKNMNISITDLEERSQQLEKELALEVQSFSHQNETQFITWKSIANVLPDSTILLEVVEYQDFISNADSNYVNSQGFVDNSNYAIFFIHQGKELRGLRLKNGANLSRQFNFYKNALKHNIEDTRSFGIFWNEINTQIDSTINKVYYSPDGIWHKINPSLLYDADKQEYVDEKYRIVHLTSGKDLLIESNTDYIKSATIFGNPDFRNINNSINLEQLPEAEREANEIEEMLNGKDWTTSTYLYLEASENKIKKIRKTGILHLATHGYFKEQKNENPLLNSGVYLSKSDDEDGILSAYEVMNLELEETLLVVLSACESGLGEIKNGEGVFGLERAFMVAGAKNLIISLVKVSDLEAREFMTLFYSNLLTNGSVEQSFYETRKKFRVKYPNPYIWGAFILSSKR